MATRYDMKSRQQMKLCYLEMVISKRNMACRGGASRKVVMFDGDEDTVRLVQEEMDAVIANVVRVTAMEQNALRKIEETSKLFEKTLDPWFSLVAQTGSNGKLLATMSNSLKKALILLAMERFRCDEESVAKVLGISVERLGREMERCGIVPKGA
jgi:DNA-binding NtrC family response regulator